MIEAVIFDMDGLMFDTEHLGIRLWDDGAKEFNQPKINEIYMQCVGTNQEYQKDLFDKLFGEGLFEKFRDFAWGRRDEILHAEGVPIKKGLINLLEFLKKNGIKTGIATSTDREPAEDVLKLAGVFEYFDAITTGNETAAGKPAPDIYLLACSKVGVKPENAMGLEDSFNGIRALHAAGMKGVMIPDLIQPDDEIKKLYYKCLNDLDEVIDLISEENGWTAQN